MARMLGISIMMLLFAAAATANISIERTESSINVQVSQGVAVRHALHQGQWLGLVTAEVGQIALRSPQTLVRPLLLQEKGPKPLAYDVFRFRDAQVVDGKAVVVCDIFATPIAETFAELFVLKDGKPFLDYYLFPHLSLPSAAMTVQRRAQWAEAQSGVMKGDAAGELRIVVEPVQYNVAGWTWRGWKHHYEVKLTDGSRLNAIRELSTWETQGEAVGNTLVALRYRGLGNLVETLKPMPDGSPGTASAFTTTEIMPGAVGQAPVVSPAVPGPQQIAGRAEGMKYRHGAWIAQLQRGAGANYVDFQYRPAVAFAAFYERMDAIRSMSEVWPGDTCISYSDCLYFPLSAEHRTVPKVHVALLPSKPLPEHEWRTRYQEFDQFVRDKVAAELGFVQHEAAPSLGINWDSGWEFRLQQAIRSVPAWKDAGIRRVITHHPGWFNGRGLRQKETAFPIPQSMQTDPRKPEEPAKLMNDTGGDCSIHDYVPQSPKVRDLWRQFARTLNEHDMEYWVWITGMVYATGPVVQQFGVDRFARNAPEVSFSSGYPGQHGRAGHRGIALRDPEIAAWWKQRMNAAATDLGVSGYWADSFQNMFMSQMNYQHADWASQARDWWEWIAAETRKGVAWMGESHSFPGLSCSIEVGQQKDGYPGVEWVLTHTTRWYRGSPVPFRGTPQADAVFFRTMANKAPIAPGDGNPGQIPGLARLTAMYNAALPDMRRPYQLPQDGGVLWLTYQHDKTGIIFAFVDTPLPLGTSAVAMDTREAATELKALTAYRVESPDLLVSFGLLRGDQADPRIGRPWEAPKVHRVDWSKQ